MTTEGGQRAAYADLVSGLLDARTDHATERFDAELAAAVSAGTVSPEAARTLKFWQRAAVRGLVDHARGVLPPALAALEDARAQSSATVDAERTSWAGATAGITAQDQSSAGDRRESIGDRDEPDDGGTGAPSVTEQAITMTDRRSRLIVAGLMPSTGTETDD